MSTRVIAAGLAFVVGIAMVLTAVTGDTGACVSGGGPPCSAASSPSELPEPTASPTPGASAPIATPSATPSVTASPGPSPTPPVYTFRDEFNGTVLRSVWGRHWPGFGATIWSRAQASVGNGVLTIKARRSGSKYVSALIDTVGTFSQKYGVFSARMKFDEGNGLWPAFWLAQAQNARKEQAEIDVAEVCANQVGVNDGNDVTLLHHYVHRIDGSHAYGVGHRMPNLAGAWHVYTVEWRKDHVTFYFDGVETSTYTFDSDVGVSDMKQVIVLDLAAGGRYCGSTDATTPAVAVLQVDWVRVTR